MRQSSPSGSLIARLIARLMGRDVEFVSDEQRLRPAGSEVERLWADNRKARELLGWQPQYGGRDGFRRGGSGAGK